MGNKKLKACIRAVSVWSVAAMLAFQPVYAAGETDASSIVEEIPEAEVENGPTEEEVTNENARTTEETDTSSADAENTTSEEPSGDVEAGEDSTEASTEEESTGQAGDTLHSTSEMDSEDACVVTFNMDVPEGVTSPCIVTFTESDSYTEYYVEAYKTAGYTALARLEPGTYIITGGGPTDDTISAYDVLDKSYFTVASDGTGDKVVNVVIRSKGDILRGNTEPSEGFGETSETETETAQTAEKAQNNHTLLYIIIAVICLAIGIFIGTVGVKWLQRQEIG